MEGNGKRNILLGWPKKTQKGKCDERRTFLMWGLKSMQPLINLDHLTFKEGGGELVCAVVFSHWPVFFSV